MTEQRSWQSLGLSPLILDQIAKVGFTEPTPVQAQAIPVALDRKDLIASAQTGTGKTASFVLPMVERFLGREGTYGLILAPTREIALQIQDTLEIFATPLKVRSVALIGGVDLKQDIQRLNEYPQVIVATPGRLCDHLDRGSLWLDFIEMVVLDEADRMLDMGFAAQLSRIMSEVPEHRQTLLFSATFSEEVSRLAKRILKHPVQLSVSKTASPAGGIDQKLLWMSEESKSRELRRLLREETGSIIVFTRSKDGASRVWRSLHSAGIYDATYIHSDRLQSHREQALAEFKEGKYRILIATDVAGRGIHVDAVAHVINYDLPIEADSYVHRIGRTGRAGSTGKATTFATPRDRKLIQEIEALMGKSIPSDTVGGSESSLHRSSGSRSEKDRRSSKPLRGGSAPSAAGTPLSEGSPQAERKSSRRRRSGSRRPLGGEGASQAPREPKLESRTAQPSPLPRLPQSSVPAPVSAPAPIRKSRAPQVHRPIFPIAEEGEVESVAPVQAVRSFDRATAGPSDASAEAGPQAKKRRRRRRPRRRSGAQGPNSPSSPSKD